MMERGDLEVIHEPFSELYYRSEERARPVGAAFSQGEPLPTYAEIRDRLIARAAERAALFKDMCYHCQSHVLQDDVFLRRLRHVFLIRDPEKSIASHYAKNPQVTREEIGYEAQWALFERLRELTVPAVVVEAEELVAAPERYAAALFEALDLPPSPDALHWQPGHCSEWDSWKAWHVEAAGSSGIERRETAYADTVHNHETLAAYLDYHSPFFRKLYERRLVPEALK